MSVSPPDPRRSRDELLADVQRRGRTLRQRRRIVTAASGLAVAALVFGAATQVTYGQPGVQVTAATEGQVPGPAPDLTATTGGPSTTTSGPADIAPSSTTTTDFPRRLGWPSK